MIAITDRTAADVAARTAKGRLQADDLNRIWANILGVQALAGGTAHAQRVYAAGDLPQLAEWRALLGAVSALAAAAPMAGAGAVPANPVSYADWNTIEAAILAVYDYKASGADATIYCGTRYVRADGITGVL